MKGGPGEVGLAEDFAVDGEGERDVDAAGPVIMAVDILPAEIPRESSIDFSRVLKQFLPEIGKADFSKGFEEVSLPPELKRAVIANQGELTAEYAYLKSFL